MTYSNSFFGIPDDDSRFNLPAAVDAYEWVMANPDTCRFVLSNALMDNVGRDIEYHRPVVDAAVGGFVSSTIAKAKTGISRSYVSKATTGDTGATEAAVVAIDVIAKAYTEQERRANTERQVRDSRGRFVVMNRKINPDMLKKPVDGSKRDGMGIPDIAATEETRRKFQNDYLQVSNALNDALRKEKVNPLASMVKATYADGSTREMLLDEANLHHSEIDDADTGLVQESDYMKGGSRIRQVQVTTDAPEGTAGPSFDVLAGMTNPRFADYVLGSARDASESDFASEWTRNGADDFRTNDQFWRRMSAASDLAATLAAPLSPEAALALKAGKWAGDLAPEAEKVIGPTARRSAYRYRGTEKKPDPIYQQSINALRRKHMGGNSPFPGRSAHEEMLNGENPGTPEYRPSRLVEKLQALLPDPQRYHLNRMSGTIPPSQGVLIDRKGAVVSEAIGYGEDWYLPFNLKNLSRLDGGEYVRTRAFGGPTTEDVYAGLTTNARAVSVVSHSGVFTIEFDDSFRGGRRYNDKAARMQDRYGKLLDAIKSKQVTLGQVPPDRLEEIKQEAAESYDPYRAPSEYKQKVRELLAREKDSPRLSNEREEQMRLSVLNDWVSSETDFRNYDDYLRNLAIKDPARYEEYSLDTQNAISGLRLDQRYEKERRDALAIYQQEMRPLDINGAGYYQALLALKDQFPYYIRAIHYTEGKGGRDYGYVKPNYIRPAGAYESYFDPTITGKGKISADQTNYQNYPRERNRAVVERFAASGMEEEDIGLPSGPPQPRPAGAPREAAKVDDLVARMRHVIGQKRFAQGIQGKQAAMSGLPIDDQDRKDMAAAYGWASLLFQNPGDLEAKLYEAGPDSPLYEKVKSDVDAALESGLFDPYAEAQEATTQSPSANAQAILGSYRGIEDGRRYAFPDLRDGQDRGYYDARIADFLVNSPGLRAANVRPDQDGAQIMNAIHAHATTLANAQRAHNRGVAPPGIPSEDEIKREAVAMMKIAQAVQMRKTAPAAQSAPPPAVRTGPFRSAPSEGAASAGAPGQSARGAERIAAIQGEIRSMTGMESVAREVDSLVNFAKVAARRAEMGKDVSDATKHLVFTGNPGTGKTTIAEKIAPIYYELGLVPEDKYYAPARSELVSDHVGGTAKAIDALFEKHHGGVILIDEAYALKNGERDTFGKEAVTAILVNAEKYRGDTVVILAGYPQQMGEFLKSDPGLESRFPTRIDFPDYDARALGQIAGEMIGQRDYSFAGGAKAMIRNAASQIAGKPNNGNARAVRNLVDAAIKAQANRIARMDSPSDEDYDSVTSDDVREAMVSIGLAPVMRAPRRKAA